MTGPAAIEYGRRRGQVKPGATGPITLDAMCLPANRKTARDEMNPGWKRRGFAGVLLLALLFSLWAVPAFADSDVVVIGHPGIGVQTLSDQVVRDLYLGKTVQLSTGTRVEIIDLPVGHPVRNNFYIFVIGRDPGQMRAYWAKRIFTGKGTPPDTRPDERSVIRWVAAGPGRIAYVSADMVDDSVKVLLRQQVNERAR
jgi:hypothetical protein